ncbi:MAG TPA: glycosyltransferase family 2 protein [Cyclobacteriaceae bacterium]|nr:glycosyltransferase family 2 protein [Cyclobacteriaceae bacterium]HRJ83296.1 glycosyltransferase family 2 protein [Cyclobacteriaceae bacterium]
MESIAGNSLWMWQDNKNQFQPTMPDGKPWPKISIVTPSYNQGHYIEETIRSVIMQGYPNLEYIVIDGGSTDDTVNIIKKYESNITYWVSEKDNGQTHAINKGFEKATGDILAYLNSDDVYMPYTFRLVAELFAKFKLNWLTGLRSHLVDKEVIAPLPTATTKFNSYLYQKGFHVPWVLGWNQQPSTFWSSSLFASAGRNFDETMQCSFDVDMWIRFSRYDDLVYVRSVLAMMRQHADQKSRTLRLDFKEIEGAARKYKFFPLWYRKFLKLISKFFILRKLVRTILGSPKYRQIDWDPLQAEWRLVRKQVF